MGTGPCADRTSHRAGGRSSSLMTATPMSTTPRKSFWRSTGSSRGRPAADAIERGVAWAVGMQSSDGGWAAFDADNTRRLIEKLPFCDFGAVIDPPSADVTAHVVEMLAARGLARYRSGPGWRALAPGRAGARRLVVRPMGCESHLRHRRRCSGTGRRRSRPGFATRETGRSLAARGAELRRRMGGRPALLRRRIVARAGRVHGLSDGMGVACAARRGR